MSASATEMPAHLALSLITGWSTSIVSKPALHGSGLDELACLALPMVLLGVVFLIVMRVRPPLEDDSEEQADAVEVKIPGHPGQGDDDQPEPPVK